MAVKDGLPSTDFSRMNREYIKAVADEAAGGGGRVFPITVSSNRVFNKTASEVYTAFMAGQICIASFEDESQEGTFHDMVIDNFAKEDGSYSFLVGRYDMYGASSGSDYPYFID